MKNNPSEPNRTARPRRLAMTICSRIARALLVAVLVLPLALAPPFTVPDGALAAAHVAQGASSSTSSSPRESAASPGGASLESAASKADEIGRKVAMSLIGLGFAIAAVVLVMRRNFKGVAGVLAVGGLAVLLATPAGVDVMNSTVKTLFGSA